MASLEMNVHSGACQYHGSSGKFRRRPRKELETDKTRAMVFVA